MKKMAYIAAAAAMVACAGNQELVIGDVTYVGEKSETKVVPVTPGSPEYTIVNNPQVNIADFPMDKDGYYVIFNGNEKMQGWRGYGKDHIPARWTVEDGCIKFNGTGGGEAQRETVVTSSSSTISRTSYLNLNGRFQKAAIPVSSTLQKR